MEYSDSSFKISLNDGVVFINWLSPYINNVSIVDKAIKERIKMQNGISYPLFSDIRKVKGGNYAVRKRMLEPDAQKDIKALGVLCQNKFQIAQFNFFHLKRRLTFPYRAFLNQDDLLLWLNQFKNDNTKQNLSELSNQSPTLFINEKFHLRLDDNILYVNWLNKKYEEEDIDFIIKKKVELLNGAFYPVITDFSKVTTGSRAAFRRLSNADSLLNIKASATICKSNVQIVLFSSFRKICNPKVPNKYFTRSESALEWISRFK